MFKNKMDLLLKNDLFELAADISENADIPPTKEILEKRDALLEEQSKLLESSKDVIETLSQFTDPSQLQAAMAQKQLVCSFDFSYRFFV